MTLEKHSLRLRFCSREYRVFLTEQPCFCGCGRTPCDPAHTVSRKRADGSDAGCLPLFRFCHGEFDAHRLKFSPEQIELAIANYQRLFLIEKRIITPDNFAPITQAEFEETLREAGFVQEPHTTRKNREPFVPYRKGWNEGHQR